MAASHLVLLLVPVADSAPTRVFSVADYGAAGDGSRYDTAAIQAAVTPYGEARGGRVVLPALGDYLTVTVHLRSRVVLELAPGTAAWRDQAARPPGRAEAVVHCAGREHHRSGGSWGGEINGQGGAFVVMPNVK